MSILSWLRVKQRFTRASALEAFDDFVGREAKRRRAADDDFNEDRFVQAVAAARQRLRGAQTP